MHIIATRHCIYTLFQKVPKTVPLLFLQYLWCLLVDFSDSFTTIIRNDQNTFQNKIFHLTLTTLPHYLTKVVQWISTILIYLYYKVQSIWAGRSLWVHMVWSKWPPLAWRIRKNLLTTTKQYTLQTKENHITVVVDCRKGQHHQCRPPMT